MKTTTQTLAAALRILANDIQSPDGVANAAILEAADRLGELMAQVEVLKTSLRQAITAFRQYELDVDDYPSMQHKQMMESLNKASAATPTQCLNQIKADAGRAGFVAGVSFRESDKWLSKNEICQDADQYAERIRQGGE